MTTDRRTELRDDYDHEDDQVEYVIENVLFEAQPQILQSSEYQNLASQFNSVLLNACRCSGACDSDITCPHGGNYISSADNELVLNPDRRSNDLIYECSQACGCDPSACRNRLVQLGPRLNLEIISSELLHKQFGLRTNAPIPRGAFVCEYAGEILTRSEAQRRMAMDNNKMNYVLCLNEYSLGEAATSPTQTFIDPRLRGNIGRYLNHSCQPNCEIFSVRVDCPIPRIGIFARQDIAAGEELCFHYGGGVNATKPDADVMPKSTPCRCGVSNCEKFLPNLEF